MYRSDAQAANPRALLLELRDEREPETLLIDFGVIEAGIADALCPDRDADHPTLRAFRRAGLLSGRLFCGWASHEEFFQAVEHLDTLDLPETITVSTPEGYAYYGLYPEMYVEAARQFSREADGRSAVVIGIRSIGTSLSSVVAAALDQMGWAIHSLTVRPRGHPFERLLVLTPELDCGLQRHGGSYFLIVDEGPGLSGSSMTSVADKLSELGIPEQRIVFFPSWEPNAATFVSGQARRRWPRHRQFTAPFEWIWPNRMTDLSAGRWRNLLYRSEAEYPAVQPQHERRKYLDASGRLHKFAGLGRFGCGKLERADRLAEAGFAPPVVGFSRGFLTMEFVPGRPVSAISPELLDRMTRYLAFVRNNFRTGRAAPMETLCEMIRTNVGEDVEAPEAESVALDGRMFPHEWIQTPGGYVKTDGLDHHDDHFFPGCQDIAWDIAGTCIEFKLDHAARDYFIERYRRAANDRTVRERLPFYFIAYPAYRLGYASLAASTLAPSADADRFRSLATRYEVALRGAGPHKR